MARPHTKNYYFARTKDLQGFEHVSTDGAIMLDQYIGETIAAGFCDNDSALDLVRLHREDEEIIVQRRITDIVLRHIIYY